METQYSREPQTDFGTHLHLRDVGYVSLRSDDADIRVSVLRPEPTDFQSGLQINPSASAEDSRDEWFGYRIPICRIEPGIKRRNVSLNVDQLGFGPEEVRSSGTSGTSGSPLALDQLTATLAGNAALAHSTALAYLANRGVAPSMVCAVVQVFWGESGSMLSGTLRVMTGSNLHLDELPPLDFATWPGQQGIADLRNDVGNLRLILEARAREDDDFRKMMRGLTLETVEKLDTIARDKYVMKKKNENLRQLTAQKVLKMLALVDLEDARYFQAILKHGDRAKAARALGVENQRGFYRRIEGWPKRGHPYTRLFEIVEGLKPGPNQTMRLPDSVQYSGCQENENPETISDVVEKLNHEDDQDDNPWL